MIKVLQVGEGNFLRTFADYYFDCLNKEGLDYGVNIIKPIPFGSLDKFKAQNNKYHIVLRGVKEGKIVEDVHKIDVLQKVISPFEEYDEYIALARDEELKLVVSNTTEAGICYNANDKIDGFAEITFPAKLTKFLLERYNAGLPGLYMMPVELIDNNADELYRCVMNYIELWNLPEGFKAWIDDENYFCNTLVDRIVAGYPRDEQTRNHLWELIGEEDALVSVGEPFGLWAVEKKGDIAQYIKEGTHGIDVVLTENIKYYKKRKVRVLNGSHTNLVPAGLWLGAKTVDQCMNDKLLCSFLQDTLNEEIIPFVSDDIAATTEFADSVTERFLNPYLNHQLISISLNSISKWRARDLPSFADYYNKYGKIPAHLTVGFSYLMCLYSSLTCEDGKFYANLPSGKVEYKDDLPYLQYFANGGDIVEFMKDEAVWGEDLTKYEGFAQAVENNVKEIKSGKVLL
ncbi:MAG: tagaturonate reductase [Clostridiales bacterium]|nr:tagaturonate reductase [Clostridiales bacterium]